MVVKTGKKMTCVSRRNKKPFLAQIPQVPARTHGKFLMPRPNIAIAGRWSIITALFRGKSIKKPRSGEKKGAV